MRAGSMTNMRLCNQPKNHSDFGWRIEGSAGGALRGHSDLIGSLEHIEPQTVSDSGFRNRRKVVSLWGLFILLGTLCLFPFSSASAAVTKDQVKGISGDLVCYCGCANKVVATCGCGTADQIEADIRGQLEAGKSREQIIAAYVAQHGEQGLATPIPRGFNVSAWIMPIAVIMAGGVVIRTVVVRWRGRARVREARQAQTVDATATAPPPMPSVADTRRQDQILRELKELD